MKILWFTWKDREHPLAGGAEVVNEELAKRLVRDGHEVRFIVGGFEGGSAEASRDGFSIVRLGGRVSVYWKAYRYYKKNFQGWADKVIDEVNTVPFFARFYVKEPNVLFIHQLAREIWFYEMFFPFNVIGFLIEPVYLWTLRKSAVVTVSESTKSDLVRYGFEADKVRIISEGIECEPVGELLPKEGVPTVLALGSIRPMKQTLDVVRAFEIAKRRLPALKLLVAGGSEGDYGKKVLEAIRTSPFASDIEYLGRVSPEQKLEAYRRAHVLAVASVREGWGLVVTEANSQGTPAVAYDAPGLRDSVRDGETGMVCGRTPEAMAEGIEALLRDGERYEKLRRTAWEWSRELTFERAYNDFLNTLCQK